jgi:uncharacterized Zn finger protein
MGRQRRKTRGPKTVKGSAATPWTALTWSDLDDWAGSRSVSRGQQYQRQGRVRDLVIAPDGRLLATVSGSRKYAAAVSLAKTSGNARQLESICTCPVGASGCKHAVAVVAEFLASLANNAEVPQADASDHRWAKLAGDYTADFDEDDYDDAAQDDFDETGEFDDVHAPPKVQRRSAAEWDAKIQSLIGQLDRADLATLVWSLVRRFPELRVDFLERVALAEPDISRLVADTRKELRKVTSEIGWRNDWESEGHTPNYSRLKHRLQRLVELGYPDEVADLGRELIERGMQQVAESHDEGETATELSECLDVVFRAIVDSSLPPPDKILFVIDACLADDYGILGESLSAVLDANSTAADWSTVADRLAVRLQQANYRPKHDFSRNYHREQISGWLLMALEKAGRLSELAAVYEAEARTTASYERFVKYLIEQGRTQDAEHWAREGIEKTQERLPGIAASLQQMLCDVARSRKQWNVVAAHAAADFFDRPSAQGFVDLIAAARKAKCDKPVRAAALAFLESGTPPIVYRARKGKIEAIADPEWSLPTIDYLAPPLQSVIDSKGLPQHYWNVLLEMAIAHKQPDAVLKWYDKIVASQDDQTIGSRNWLSYGGPSYSDQVAAAVATSHPHRALEIYRRGLDSWLPQANHSAYEACAGYLKKMRTIYQSLNHECDWQQLIADIRQKYGNRPRFMEVLDRLDGRTILQTATGRRRGQW